MAQCRNFFDDSGSPTMCRETFSAERMSPTMASSDEEEAGLHNNEGLELRLGLFHEETPRQQLQHIMVKPIPLYPNVLDGQRSESFANALENDALLGTQAANNSKGNLFSQTRVGSAFSTPHISRDQVWQTLERGNVVLGEDMGSKPISTPSSLWSRRSTSMQITMPTHDASGVKPHPIRRSSSNGGLIPRHDSFNIDLCVNERSAHGFPSSHEALELQRKKEIQAHRRLEARKRRRLQLEEKHQKKVLQLQNSMQFISPNERSTPQLCIPCVDDTKVPLIDEKHEQEWLNQGARGNAMLQEDVSMGQASNFSETESIGSKEDNTESGSKPGDHQSPSPSQKSSTESNNDTAMASLPVLMPMHAGSSFSPSSAMATQESSQHQISKVSGYFTVLGFPLAAGKSSDFWATKKSVVKKSVGVFSEGRWKIADAMSDISSIRRTASYISQVVSEPLYSSQAAGSQASAAASQQSFAKIAADMMRQERQAGIVKQEQEALDCSNSVSQMENPILLLFERPGLVQDATSAAIANKVEEEVMELCEVDIANKVKQEAIELCNGDIEGPKAHLGIDRQRSCPFPELPWVSATGKGPNGKTITGVLYISSGSVRLVCRCHGKHMSPVEFVEHSGSTDLSNPMKNIIVKPFGPYNQVAV